MDCIFCKIIKRELPAKIRYEDDDFLAFDDIHPKAKVHILLITKQHFKSLNEVRNNSKLLGNMLLTARKIALENGLRNGYRIVINTGKEAGQIVDHIHFHILSGSKLE